MFTDPIADYLTRVRNAQMAGKKVVEIPASNIKKAITEILHDKGYILNFKFEETANNQGNIKVALKYNMQTNMPAMKKLIRISKPGLRKYADSKTLPRVINGLGIAILSTSKGVITDKEARNENVGGEVLCHVY
jgi:small subunit ribosomal protein S8